MQAKQVPSVSTSRRFLFRTLLGALALMGLSSVAPSAVRPAQAGESKACCCDCQTGGACACGDCAACCGAGCCE